MLKLLYKRRSIREFTEDKVSDKMSDKLVKSLLLSPSSRNIRPWRFIIITDKEIIQKIAVSKPNGVSALSTAPMAVVIIGLTDKSDVWIEDCSVASIILQLEAESLGLGSCWIQIRNRQTADGKPSEKYLSELLGLNENESVESIIAIGHPEKWLPARKEDQLPFDKIEFIAAEQRS